jgi:hypothetical protein
MLTLFFSFILLTVIALVIGNSVVGYLKADEVFDRPADRAILSIWLGIILLANSFFAISTVSSLSLPITLGFTTLLTFVALIPTQSRRSLGQLVTTTGISTSLGIIAIALGTAAYCSQVLIWYDSGLYHVQYIKWLSEIGLVPGMGLIHWRFGISSSWFALAAPFNHGIMTGRMFTMPGGFCLWMLLLQGGVATSHLITQRGRLQDLFMLCSIILAIPLVLLWGTPNSPSPDLPVICLEIVTAWAILAISQLSPITQKKSVQTITLVLIILAAGAMSIKLSAAPLLVVVGLYHLFYRGFTFTKLLTGTALITTILAPLATAGVLIVGCVFFPSPLTCLDVPWALGAQVVAEKARIIQNCAKWGAAQAPVGVTTWNWLFPWVRSEKIGSALILLSLVTAVGILGCSRYRQSKGTLPIIAIGLSGISFMLCTAPSWRFGLGYLILLPALSLTLWGNTLLTAFLASPFAMLRNSALLGTIAALSIALHSHILQRPSYKLLDSYFASNPEISGYKPHFSLFLPPTTQNICNITDSNTGDTVAIIKNVLIKKQAQNFIYFKPEKSDTCWDSPLPCTADPAEDPSTNIALRDRQQGIAGGFVRSTVGRSR